MSTSVLVAVLWTRESTIVCVRRTLHLDHGVRELRHTEDLPADPQVPPEHGSWSAEPLHHRLLPHCSGHATPQIQNGDLEGFHAFTWVEILNRHLSLQIVHCDLALRNIMVNKFPWEVKVAEFSLAKDMNRMSRRSSRWRSQRVATLSTHTHTHKWWKKPSFLSHIAPFLGLLQ